jgi:hypothetical protein
MPALDLNRLAASAVGAYLAQAEQTDRGGHEAKKKRRRLGPGTALAVGAGLAVAARAAYKRVRDLDLEEVGAAVENKLKS